MKEFCVLDKIEDIGDVEGNFIIDLAQGIAGFINTIDAKLNKIKGQHLSYLDNLQNSDLISDISKKDYTEETFKLLRDEVVYKVPRSKTFYGVNDFYIESLHKLLKFDSYLEDSIKEIKRFRTKPKSRLSVAGPSLDTLAIETELKEIDKDKKKVFDVSDTSEYAKVGKYFGNVKTIHKNIDNMVDLDGEINDRYLHSMKVDVERLSSELKKLIDSLDKADTVISKEAMNSILLTATVAADYITSISNLYYIHIESITSLVALKNK